MWRERVQAAAVILFVLAIAGVVACSCCASIVNAPAAKGPSPTPSNDIDSAAKDPVGRVSLSAGKGNLVVRVTAGSCAEAGRTEARALREPGPLLSPDPGAPDRRRQRDQRCLAQGARHRLRRGQLAAQADRRGCRHERATCTGTPPPTAGVTWTQEDGAVGEWYVDPKTGGVVSPTGPTDVGCSGIVSLAPVRKLTAKAFCADGTIRGTSDRGSHVGPLRPAPQRDGGRLHRPA